jgi:hypothetical protein
MLIFLSHKEERMNSKGFTYKFKVDAEITDLIAKTN